MTPSIKQAAEEWANARMIDGSLSGRGYMPALTTSFLAGDAHGFARAVKMLREEASGMATPKTWATWLEEQEKEE